VLLPQWWMIILLVKLYQVWNTSNCNLSMFNLRSCGLLLFRLISLTFVTATVSLVLRRHFFICRWGNKNINFQILWSCFRVVQPTFKEEKIKERITAGNKAFYAHQNMLQSKLLSRKSKLVWYRTLIRPIVTYDSETWVLKKVVYRNSWYLKEKYWGKSLEQPELNGLWWIKTSEELGELIQRKL
jgi:hypothetical protein